MWPWEASCYEESPIEYILKRTLRTTEMYVRASPAEKLDILESNTPPSIRPGTFLGVRDSLMELLGGK